LIADALSGEGYHAATAASGREALDVGARYRPDVLVTDWMLKDDIHGLHVAEVLRAFLPDLQSILMTSFPSSDLRAGADKDGVHAFLVKPFDSAQVEVAVRDAILHEKHAPGPLSFAMIEIDSLGSVVFANARAKEMMCVTRAGPDAVSLAELFADGTLPDLDEAIDRWISVPPLRTSPRHWHVRSQKPLEDGSRLIVLRRWDEPQYFGSAQIAMLLGVSDSQHHRWPFSERILVVDGDASNRGMYVPILESAGAGCYAVATHEDAWRLLENDDGIGFVILESDTPGMDPRPFVEKAGAAFPDLVLVGHSDADRRDDFAAMGVMHFLRKPWRAENLINTLVQRIGNCVLCGLGIPLRHPGPDESAGSWRCRGCGCRYVAVFDDDCPPDIRSNVQPADPG
jgi:CheY-like chemotaxis protein